MGQLSESNSSEGTTSAFGLYSRVDTTTSGGSVGVTVARATTRPAGSLMSDIARWLVEVKSFEITGVAILLSVFVASVLVGAWFGIKFNLNRSHDTLVMDGVPYRARGFMQVKDGEKTIYVPFYQEAPLEKIIH